MSGYIDDCGEPYQYYSFKNNGVDCCSINNGIRKFTSNSWFKDKNGFWWINYNV